MIVAVACAPCRTCSASKSLVRCPEHRYDLDLAALATKHTQAMASVGAPVRWPQLIRGQHIACRYRDEGGIGSLAFGRWNVGADTVGLVESHAEVHGGERKARITDEHTGILSLHSSL